MANIWDNDPIVTSPQGDGLGNPAPPQGTSVAPAASAAPASSGDTAPWLADKIVKPAEFGTLTPAAPYDATDAAVHGLTLGLSDPLRAAGTAAYRYFTGATPSFDYQGAEHEMQAGRDAYVAAHPWANAASNIAGGLASLPAEAGSALTAAPGLLSNVAKSVATGLGVGAVSGAADNADSLSNAVSGARRGAEVGGILGAAVPAVTDLAPAGYNAVRNSLYPAATADNQAVRSIAGAFGKDAAGGGPTPTDVANKLSSYPPGTPAMIPDVAGKNVQNLYGSLYRSNSPASQVINNAITTRDAGAGTRLMTGLDTTAGAGPATYDAEQGLRLSQQTNAAPLYETAYNAPPLNPDTLMQGGALQKLMQRPSMKQAMAKSTNLAAEEGRDPASLGIDIDAQGNPTFTKVPSWQTLDYIKGSLDDLVSSARNPITQQLDRAGNAINNTRRDFVSFLDENNSDLAAARSAWAGPAAALDALHLGSTFKTMSPAQISATLADMSPSEQQFFRLGGINAVRNKILSTPDAANEANAVANSDLARQQLKPLFPSSDDYDQFINSVVEPEKAMFNTRYKTGLNSLTAERMAADRNEGGSIIWPVTAGLMSGHIAAAGAPIAGRALRPLMERMSGNTPQAQTAAAAMLSSTNPAYRQMILDQALALSQQNAGRSYFPPVAGLIGGRQSYPTMLTGLLAPPQPSPQPARRGLLSP